MRSIHYRLLTLSSLNRRKHGAAVEIMAALRSHGFKLGDGTELSDTGDMGGGRCRELKLKETEAQRLSRV